MHAFLITITQIANSSLNVNSVRNPLTAVHNIVVILEIWRNVRFAFRQIFQPSIL